MRLTYIGIVTLLLITYEGHTQQLVTGRVVDFETSKPVRDAIVSIAGSSISTTTNAMGFFQLMVDTTNSLKIESAGYETGLVRVPPLSKFQIQIKKAEPSETVQIENDFEKGTIIDGYKTGIWEYYDKPGELSIKINHETGELIYLKKDTASRYAVESGGRWVASKLDNQPRFIGSMTEFYKMFLANIRYPAEARHKSISGTLFVVFEVDTTGHAVNFSVLNDLGAGCGEQSLKAVKAIPNFWLVASKNEIKYKSRFILPVTFTQDAKRNRYGKIISDLPLANMLDEMFVTVVGIVRPKKRLSGY